MVVFPILLIVVCIKDCWVLYVRILLYEKFYLLEVNGRTPWAQRVRLASTYTATCKRIQHHPHLPVLSPGCKGVAFVLPF